MAWRCWECHSLPESVSSLPRPGRSQNSPSCAPAVRQMSRVAAARRHLSPPWSHDRWAGGWDAEPGHSPCNAPHHWGLPPFLTCPPPAPRRTLGGPWASAVFPNGRPRARQPPLRMSLPSPLSDETSGQIGGQTDPGVGAASRERRTSQKLRCGWNTQKAGVQDGTCAAEKPSAGGL